MKLSKIILENKKFVVREELNLSPDHIEKLAEAITLRLEDYLDIDNATLLHESVKAAINELVIKNEI